MARRADDLRLLKTDEQRPVLTFFCRQYAARPAADGAARGAGRAGSRRCASAFDATMRDAGVPEGGRDHGLRGLAAERRAIAALVAAALATPKDIVKLAERATQSE